MRDLYNQCVEENIPFSETVGTGLTRLFHYVPYGVSQENVARVRRVHFNLCRNKITRQVA